MSVIQEKAQELRYIRRKELAEEAKVIGNYYRDIIRSYGIDCHYFHMRVPEIEQFRRIIDQNSLLLNAYGYNDSPCYEISSDMITYMEVDNDIFNLNKFGLYPNTDVNFYFDSTDFALAFSEKLGQLKEYKIYPKNLEINLDLKTIESLDVVVPFESEIMSGKLSFDLDGLGCDCCDIDSITSDTFTAIGYPIEYSKPKLVFPTNEFIGKSFNYKLSSEDFNDFLAFLDFRLIPGNSPTKFSLSGNVYGGILFRDLNVVGKYADAIKPQVGDIVTIDFPDEQNREQYEITECTNKQLTSNGINPLLHTYIWKCRAKRFVDCENSFPEKNLANAQINEKLDLTRIANDFVSQKISIYENDEDKVYGGYSRVKDFDDLNSPLNNNIVGYYEINDGTLIDIFTFSNKNKLCTNGYDLFFVLGNNEQAVKINLTNQYPENQNSAIFDTESELQFLKATDSGLYFVNVENNVYQLVAEKDMPPEEIKANLNSLSELTLFSNNSGNPNKNQDSFYKFRNCETVLFSIGNNLYYKTPKNFIKVV